MLSKYKCCSSCAQIINIATRNAWNKHHNDEVWRGPLQSIGPGQRTDMRLRRRSPKGMAQSSWSLFQHFSFRINPFNIPTKANPGWHQSGFVWNFKSEITSHVKICTTDSFQVTKDNLNTGKMREKNVNPLKVWLCIYLVIPWDDIDKQANKENRG